MMCDNSSAVTITNSEKDFKSQRHCKRRLMYMRQAGREGEAKPVFLAGKSNMSDIGTKNLDVPGLHPALNTVTVEVSE